MTIIAGFLCCEGWIIAADSQEMVSDYSKKTTDKIRLLEVNKDWRIGFAAAGHGSYADMLQWRIEKACAKATAFDFDTAERINLSGSPRPSQKTYLDALQRQAFP